jgi:hypothetical protein
MHRRPIDLRLVNAPPQVAGAIDRGPAVAEDKRDAKDQNKTPDEKGRRPKGQGRPAAPPAKAPQPAQAQTGPKEIGGRKGPDPTRYGDWEKKGRCIDF